MNPVFKSFVACAAGSVLASPCAADVYTVEVQGVVTEVRSTRGLLPAALAAAQPGQAFSFRYYFQDGMPDADASSSRGQYYDALFDEPESGVFATVTVAGNTFALPSPTGEDVRDRAHFAGDNYAVGSSGTVRDQLSYQKVSCAGGTTACFNIIVLAYRDAAAGQPLPDAVTSDAMAVAPTALESFTTRTMRFHAGTATGVRNQSGVDSIIGTIGSVSVTSGLVPPPPPPRATKTPCECTCPRG